MKYLRVTMPNGETYDILAHYIAHSRADYYSHNDPEYREEYQYTLDNDDELMDWAKNNMNWEDVVHVAELVIEDTDDDDEEMYQEGWVNGPSEIITYDELTPR